MIHEEHLQRAITLLRASYTHLILDLSKSFSVTDLTAMRLADVILLVTQLELSSLRNAVRILMTMGTEEGLGDRVKVVLNRLGAEYQGGDISVKKAEEILGKPIYWQVPNDAKAMVGSRNAGVPLIQHAPRSKVQQSLATLATMVCSKKGGEEPQKAGGGYFRWKKG